MAGDLRQKLNTNDKSKYSERLGWALEAAKGLVLMTIPFC